MNQDRIAYEMKTNSLGRRAFLEVGGYGLGDLLLQIA